MPLDELDAAKKNTCLVLEPTAFPYLKEFLLGVYNDLQNYTVLDGHFFGYGNDLSNLPNTPLGLPGRFGGMGLRDFFAYPLCCCVHDLDTVDVTEMCRYFT